MSAGDIFLGLIAIFFPPLPVFIKRSICSADAVINIALCILGYIPGLLHSWWIIADSVEDQYDRLSQQDLEGQPPTRPGSGTTYYYVSHRPAPSAPARPGPDGLASQHAGRGYGTVNAPAGPSGSGSAPPPQQQGGVPPSYAEAVSGDNKIQTNE